MWGACWVPGHCVRGSTHIRSFHPQIFLQREDLWSPILGKKRLSETSRLTQTKPSPPHTCGSQWGWNCPHRAFWKFTGAFWGHGWHLEGGPGMRWLPCSGGRTAHVQHRRSYLSHNTAHAWSALWLGHHTASLAWPHFPKR